MADLKAYEYESTDLDDPANSAVSVSPSDVTDLTDIPRALYIGGAGDITVNMFGSGAGIVFAGLPAGAILPIRVSRVLATGTTSASIVALY